jgi:hypothetical protein
MFEDMREARPIINANAAVSLYYRLFRLPWGENPQNIKPIKVSY